MLRVFGILVAFGFLAFSQDSQDTSGRKVEASLEVKAGKTQFQQACSFCHGSNARGASGPDLIHSALVSHDVQGDLVGQVVRNGRPEKGMPAFQLSEAQIRSVAAYLHWEAHLASTTYQRGPGEYPVSKLLVGDTDAGKSYFNGPGNCIQCHSTSGDLAHVASKYKPVELQSRIAFPSGALPTVTVTEPSGVVFTGSETYSDEFMISLKDKSGWIHSWNRGLVRVVVDDPLAAHVKLLTTLTDADLHNLFAYLETLK